MNNRQYYKDTESNKIYYVDICVGDINDCLNSLSSFINNFNIDNLLYVSIPESNTTDYDMFKKCIPKNVENNVFMYTGIDIKSMVAICDHNNLKRLQNYIPWLVGKLPYHKNESKQQKVFNITKIYIRELKIKRVLNKNKSDLVKNH